MRLSITGLLRLGCARTGTRFGSSGTIRVYMQPDGERLAKARLGHSLLHLALSGVAVEKLLDRNVFLAAIIAAAEFVLLPSAR
jgi:hypothetical protein